MHRYFITGTDTDVGKTRVTAGLALALRRAGANPTIVKLVQTGLVDGEPGDAAHAGTLANVPAFEFARFKKPADPWSAALAASAPAPEADMLAARLAEIPGSVVAEGAGGIMVPLNAREHFGHVAARGGLATILVVGLRLGCINHALLTAALCEQLRLPVAGAVLVERWEPVEEHYRSDVVRALQGKLKIFGIVPFALDEASSVEDVARLFETFVR